MKRERDNRIETWIGGALFAGALTLGLWFAWADRAAVAPRALPLLLLTLGGAGAAALATRGSIVAAPRLALTFVLVALSLIPSPASILVGLGAAIAGSGSGVAGRLDRRVSSIAGLSAALGLVGVAKWLLPLPPGSAVLLSMGGAFLVIQLLSFSVPELMPGALGASPSLFPRKPQLLLELANIPLAWLLLQGILRDAWIESLVLGGLVLSAQAASRRLARSNRSLRRTHADMEALITELDTLHAIGREILSCLDPKRLGQIIDRECRKIFDVELSLIALAQADGSPTGRFRCISSSQPGLPEATCRALVTHVADSKQGLLIQRTDPPQAADEMLEGLAVEGLNSAVAVPMIVEDRVIGVLALFSGESAAYDAHQLRVLTTIAQQAAVALENARHFEMATVDSLTGFFLREYFFGRLNDEYRRSTRYEGEFSLLMLDLDGFKAINDRHGHPAGDAYLRSISKTIDAQLRSTDLGCRYGGDEFCLLLPETDFDGARAIAERIRRAISSAVVVIDGTAVRATASIGLASFPAHDSGDAEGLLRKADEALYQAKRAGRDCVVAFAA